jgi:hypothetical protein
MSGSPSVILARFSDASLRLRRDRLAGLEKRKKLNRTELSFDVYAASVIRNPLSRATMPLATGVPFAPTQDLTPLET